MRVSQSNESFSKEKMTQHFDRLGKRDGKKTFHPFDACGNLSQKAREERRLGLKIKAFHCRLLDFINLLDNTRREFYLSKTHVTSLCQIFVIASERKHASTTVYPTCLNKAHKGQDLASCSCEDDSLVSGRLPQQKIGENIQSQSKVSEAK